MTYWEACQGDVTLLLLLLLLCELKVLENELLTPYAHQEQETLPLTSFHFKQICQKVFYGPTIKAHCIRSKPQNPVFPLWSIPPRFGLRIGPLLLRLAAQSLLLITVDKRGWGIIFATSQKPRVLVCQCTLRHIPEPFDLNLAASSYCQLSDLSLYKAIKSFKDSDSTGEGCLYRTSHEMTGRRASSHRSYYGLSDFEAVLPVVSNFCMKSRGLEGCR